MSSRPAHVDMTVVYRATDIMLCAADGSLNGLITDAYASYGLPVVITGLEGLWLAVFRTPKIYGNSKSLYQYADTFPD